MLCRNRPKLSISSSYYEIKGALREGVRSIKRVVVIMGIYHPRIGVTAPHVLERRAPELCGLGTSYILSPTSFTDTEGYLAITC